MPPRSQLSVSGRCLEPPISEENVGNGRSAAHAAAHAIGAAAAVAANASERNQPPTLKLSTGMVSIVQPNRTPGRKASAAIVGHSSRSELRTPPSDPGARKHESAQHDSGERLNDPVWMIGDRAAESKFRRMGRAIENSPIAADRPFEPPLPGLVESFDDVDAEIFAVRKGQYVLNDARLVRWRRPCAFAHPAGTRPADFADDDLLVRNGGGDLSANAIDVGCGQRCRQREVLPIRQDMDGHEIDRALQVAITQPVFPHVRIGHWHRHLRLHFADNCSKVGGGHFAAQEHLVPDDDGTDRVRELLGEFDGGGDLAAVFLRIVGQPKAVQDLQSVALGDFRNFVETVLDRIGAHAIGVVRQKRQILIDLLRRHDGALDQGILTVAKRRVRHAVKLFAGRERRRGKLDGCTQPPPGCGNRERGKPKKRKGLTEAMSWQARHERRISLAGAPCQAQP